ncbi:AAA domain-containing protein [Actinoplanes sp. NPDC020271]|uniref:AAA domain-containing protein n=1 Tax=Actinoplanes sp. NPDC020271 TaxID=3363896 RepID=UPI0037B25935
MTSLLFDEDAPATIRDRAAALTEYLLAVRAQMERPARAVPTGAAIWEHRLPELSSHLQLGPGGDETSWLRVTRPPMPKVATLVAPPRIAPLLDGPLQLDREPAFQAPAGTSPERTRRLAEEVAAWVAANWRPWVAQHSQVVATRQLYTRLNEMRSRLDMNAATEELVWGHGVLHLDIAGQQVRYPLVTTPVAIEYDPDKGMVSVSPQGPSRLQTDALSGLDDKHLRQLLALGDNGVITVDLWDQLERRELLERALRRLGHESLLRDATGPAIGEPHIHDTGVLFVRPKQRMLRRFLESFRDRLVDGSTESVGALASILAHEPSRLRMPGEDPQRWGSVGGRLLMPLPTNEAQESIARRLSANRNVAVQGPPGTGKTHTIRNLICHLMANGKRVLVVAQKEDPLRVLRDGLPDEVKSLCLAVLGRSADQLVQLQLAARELSDRAATLDQRREQSLISSLTTQIEEAERELGRTLAALRSIAESDARTYRIDDALLNAADIGEWLAAREEAFGDIPDAVRDEQPAPLTADQFTLLLDLAQRLSQQDRVQSLRHLPVHADLPQSSAVLAARQRLATLAAALGELSNAGVHLEAVRQFGPEGFADLARRLNDAINLLRRREGAWVDRLGQQLADPQWQQLWSQHVSACQTAITQLAGLTVALGGHVVTVAEGYASQPRQLQTDLAEIRQRFAAGKSVSRLFQSSLAKLVAECLVDGEPLRTVEDVDLVSASVMRMQVRNQLAGRWIDWTQWLAIPATEMQGAPEMWVSTLIEQARVAVRWDHDEWPGLYAALRQVIPQLEPRTASAALQPVADLMDRATALFEYDRLTAAQNTVAAVLQQGMSHPEASDLWRILDLQWQNPQLAGWDETCAEIRRLAALRPEATTYAGLAARLTAVAPLWAGEIDAGKAAALQGTGPDCLLRWRWRQVQTWFDQVIGDLDAETLSRRVERSRESIRSLTRELVVASAWLAVSQSLDDRKRAALADWATSLRKIGKGTGKKASHWQAEAQRQMAAAVEAVPVWVMSIDRAVEQFTNGARFDVIIVDEASQADMFALPVLALAERAVVVGDDQQIGPQLTFIGDVQGLIEAHMEGVPSANQFDPEGSLYDHAVRRSDRILLTEHFRCVPQIIEFSSANYYDHKIEPLRTDRPAGIGAPVRTVHAPAGIRQAVGSFGDVNVEEARLLVERVESIVADPAYEGKTLGVISLLSTSDQGMYLLQRLQERIGLDEMERRRLRVGDSYTFQGDERDVVLLSLVASSHERIAPFTKRDYHRRVNVAASRARDQLWVFHSFQPSDVPADDARGRLLSYCQNVGSATEAYEDLEKRCDSDFERAVLKQMLLRDLRPLPQFKIGSYRIDFVLPLADGRRLAVECDGDAYHGPEKWEEDIRRQALLERVGNCVFVRIRGSAFSRSPAAAMEPLWRRIEELGGVAAPEPVAELIVEPLVEPAEPVTELSEPGVIEPEPVELDVVEPDVIAVPAPEPVPAAPPAPRVITVRPAPQPRAAASSEDTFSTEEMEAAAGASRYVPVPEGFRSVAWVRPSEAEAAIRAYQTKVDAPVRENGKVVGWIRYYSDNSPDAIKYRANALLERASPSGARFICWLRESEAESLVRASHIRAGVPVVEFRRGAIGHVEYYSPATAEAIRFRSVTRLLRKRGAGL